MKAEKVRLLAKDCVIERDVIYFIAKNINLLFAFNVKTKNIELMGCVPCEEAIVDELCGSIEIVGDKLILSANKTSNIWIYDLKTFTWTKIARKRLEHIGTGGMLQIVLWKEKVFLVGSSYPAIVKLDVQKCTLSYYEEPFDKARERKRELKDAYFRSHHAVKDNYLYLASCIDNYVLKFDMDTEKYAWVEVGDSECRYSGITWDGQSFWLAPRTNGPIVKWNGEDEVKKYLLSGKYEADINYFFGVCCDGDEVVFPNMTNREEKRTIRISIDSEEIKYVEKQYVMMKEYGRNKVIAQGIDGEICFINSEGQECKCLLECEVERLTSFFKLNGIKLFEQKEYYSENVILSIENFLEFVMGENRE